MKEARSLRSQLVSLPSEASTVGASPEAGREHREGERWGDELVTLQTDGMPWSMAIADVCFGAGLAVVVPIGVEGEVSVDVADVPVRRALRELAELQGLEVVYSEGVVAFREPGPARGWGVVSSSGHDPQHLAEAFRVVAPEAQTARLGASLIVGGLEDESVVEDFRIAMGSGPAGWLVEVQLWSVSARARSLAGLDVDAAFELDAVQVASGSVESTVDAFGSLRILAAIERDSGEAELVSDSRLRLVEGEPVRLVLGDSVPVPRRVVSDAGTVSTLGYDIVQTGFTLDLAGRRAGELLHVAIVAELSEVTGFVEEAPIVGTRRAESSAIVDSGEWVAVTGFDSWGSQREGVSEWLPVGAQQTRSSDGRSYALLIRATRVRS